MDSQQASAVIHSDEPDCAFCSSSRLAEWFNTPLASQDDCAIAVPSLGSFVPGYLLVVPTVHVPSTSKMPANTRASFASFTSQLVSQLASLYKAPITMFEHGACAAPEQARSACITHAHLHLVPGSYGLMSEATGEITKHDSFEEFLADGQEGPYLMVQDPGGPLISFEDRPASQFFRQIIARQLKMPECWDYALFPFFETVRQTYRDFGLEAG